MQLIDIHTHKHYIDDTIYIQSYLIDQTPDPKNFFSIGLHPWQAYFDIDLALKIIRKYCQNPNCLAIGEVGLDKIKPNIKLQLTAFDRQLQLAQELNKPVIIHAVKSYNEILNIRKHYPALPWIIHGFNGSEQTALQLIRKNIHLSFGKILLNPNSKAVKAFASLPLDRIFLETDTSNLHVSIIYKVASDLKNISVQDLAEKIYANFKNLFPTF